jgi:hypothetical protein
METKDAGKSESLHDAKPNTKFLCEVLHARPLVQSQMGGLAYVRGNIDSIAICILRCAICILQKILGNIVLDSKSF